MRIIISGGGTGGHIYPALAIAQEFQQAVPGAEIIFIGTEKGLENKILANYDYQFYHIEVSGFSRKLSKETLASARKAFKGLRQAVTLVKKIKPDLVIGTGGYVCGPVVLAAALCGIKTCIQEQNAVPGVTNKILAKFADRIFLGSPAAAVFFKNSKTVVSGNPIRQEILGASREAAFASLALAPGKMTILVSGGSRGALSINNAMSYVNGKLGLRDDVQVVHITGQDTYAAVMDALPDSAKEADNIKIIPYMDDMAAALAAADLAVFRAGALGLAELAACGIPSVLVPYPYAAENHQEHNARAFEKEGAAIVVRDRELSGEGLLGLLEILLADKERLSNMAACAKMLGKSDAAQVIVENILSLLGQKR